MMNERILKLLKQSGAYDYYEVNPGVDGDELPMIKFAQLIVLEVFSKIEDEGFEIYEPTVDAVKQYFRIEEPKEFAWVCEKCGADRTKEPCQLAVEGKVVYGNCPIVGVAQ